jgi:predicted ATPase
MRLIHLRIPDYRVLKDVDINFERTSPGKVRLDPRQGYALDFFAGVNGTGKSTVLRLIGKIFTTLGSEDYSFPIPIELSYSVDKKNEGGKTITVTNFQQNSEGAIQIFPQNALKYRVNDDELQTGKVPANLQPTHVVIYTTGSESEWKDELGLLPFSIIMKAEIIHENQDEDQLFLSELPGHLIVPIHEEVVFAPSHPILFIYQNRLPLVTLCGLVASLKTQVDGHELLRDVLSSIGIDGLAAFSLKIRSDVYSTHSSQIDTINKLIGCADQVIQTGSDHLFIFHIDQQLRRDREKPSIFTLYNGVPIELFIKLNQLYESLPYYEPPIQEVNLFMRRKSLLHLYDWLSDGERSFLGRMALFTLFREDNLLILMDEPEVHFNDVWKREIVNMLDQILSNHSSHVVIATHSSITLSDVRPEDILVFRRQDEWVKGEDAVKEAQTETFGADPSDIMVHVFNTSMASGEMSSRYIRRKIGESNTVEELETLQKIVAPGYWRYRIQMEVQRLTKAQ